MDRSGRLLNPPVDGIGTDDGGGLFVGPFDPKVSPDGKRIAYWFGQYTSRYSYACYCYLYTVESRSAWTWADHFKPYSEDAFATGIEQPSWLGNDRIFATFPSFYMSAWTWKLDSGHPSQDAQWSFALRDPDGSYRLDLSDGEVSPDGSKVAVTAGGDATTQDQLWLFTTNGPLWAGEPPYDNFAQSGPLPAQPDARCAGTVGKIVSPTWSPRADALAFSLADGVYAMPVGNIAASCDGLSGALIAPGGSQPDWGPAPVDMSQAPAPAPGSGSGQQKPAAPPAQDTALTLRDVSITRRFKAARPGARRAGGTLRFTVSEPARVKLTVKRRGRAVGRIRTAGKPGVNEQRVTGRIGKRTLSPAATSSRWRRPT